MDGEIPLQELDLEDNVALKAFSLSVYLPVSLSLLQLKVARATKHTVSFLPPTHRKSTQKVLLCPPHSPLMTDKVSLFAVP